MVDTTVLIFWTVQICEAKMGSRNIWTAQRRRSSSKNIILPFSRNFQNPFLQTHWNWTNLIPIHLTFKIWEQCFNLYKHNHKEKANSINQMYLRNFSIFKVFMKDQFKLQYIKSSWCSWENNMKSNTCLYLGHLQKS